MISLSDLRRGWPEMALSSFAAALAALAALAAAQAPSVPPVVHRAEVVWPDADWPGEMASLPLGNGDVSAQAWVARASGDLSGIQADV